MIVLGLDTATPACSVAVGNETGVLVEALTTVAETHSRHLLRLVRQVCASAGIDIEAVDGYAVTGGPGSFTGLRIGISTVKGLCYALRKPLVAVSTLEVLASQACCAPGMDGSGTILALIDARRGEVYAGWYSRDADGRLKASGTAQAAPVEEVIRKSASMGPLRVVGDGALRYRREVVCAFGTEAVCPDDTAHVPRASTLVQLAMARFPEGRTVDAASFAPEYIRKPDIRLPTG